MSITALILFGGALFVASGTPGPSIAALVARVLARGPRDVLPFLAAMWVGEAVWLTLAVLGLAAIAQTAQPVFLAIKWVGVIYLLYLAWKMWSAADEDGPGNERPRGSAARMFVAGLTVTLGNPKIALFYLALLPTLIDLTTITFAGWAELVAVMVAVLAFVDFAWVLLAARAARLFRAPAARRAVNRASGGVMAGAAVAIAAR